MQARFTALYVRTGTKSEDLDKEKLEEHIRYAENLGAEIVMTHGENIPYRSQSMPDYQMYIKL